MGRKPNGFACVRGSTWVPLPLGGLRVGLSLVCYCVYCVFLCVFALRTPRAGGSCVTHGAACVVTPSTLPPGRFPDVVVVGVWGRGQSPLQTPLRGWVMLPEHRAAWLASFRCFGLTRGARHPRWLLCLFGLSALLWPCPLCSAFWAVGRLCRYSTPHRDLEGVTCELCWGWWAKREKGSCGIVAEKVEGRIRRQLPWPRWEWQDGACGGGGGGGGGGRLPLCVIPLLCVPFLCSPGVLSFLVLVVRLLLL